MLHSSGDYRRNRASYSCTLVTGIGGICTRTVHICLTVWAISVYLISAQCG